MPGSSALARRLHASARRRKHDLPYAAPGPAHKNRVGGSAAQQRSARPRHHWVGPMHWLQRGLGDAGVRPASRRARTKRRGQGGTQQTFHTQFCDARPRAIAMFDPSFRGENVLLGRRLRAVFCRSAPCSARLRSNAPRRIRLGDASSAQAPASMRAHSSGALVLRGAGEPASSEVGGASTGGSSTLRG